MQKMEHILWRGILTVITAAALFVVSYRYISAEEISGTEVYFTHSHVAGCKTVERVRCSRTHYFNYHTSEKETYHCSSCNAQTTHNVEIDVYRCMDTGDTWQENAYTKCTICGTIHSTWGGPPGDTHFYNKENITCGISEGERTSGVKIVADGAWTNQGVTLEAKRTVLKNDSSGSVTFSWDGGSLFVTENGTYTVRAVNGAGASVTASIEINCIDKAVPVILSVSGDTQGMTRSGISVSVAAEDGESGLADAPYSFDGGATWTAGSSFWVEEGRTISLCVRDKAGNISEKIVKRSDFPYPPPAPTPAPAPTSPPASQSSDTKNEVGGGDTDTRTSAEGEDNKNSGTLSKDDGTFGSLENPETGGQGNTGGKNGESKSSEGGKAESGKTGNGKAGSGRAESEYRNNESEKSGNADESVEDAINKRRSYQRVISFQAGLQPAILKEEAQGNNAESSFRVVRMDKAQAADAAGAGALEAGTAAMASYMREMTAGRAARYALTGGGTLQESRTAAGLGQQVLDWIKANAGLITGAFLFCFGILWGSRILWLYSAELYCYDGGSEYRRLGFLHIRKRKKELELYLPDYILVRAGAPRYRLVVKSRLVKRFGKMDLVVHSDEYRLRRPLEECVDFVL